MTSGTSGRESSLSLDRDDILKSVFKYKLLFKKAILFRQGSNIYSVLKFQQYLCACINELRLGLPVRA